MKGLAPLIVDEPERTPISLRTPYRLDAWAALTSEERRAHARKILKEETFDELVAYRGVDLDSADI